MKDFIENDRAKFARREEECEFLFNSQGPFWHLCTPGTEQEIIFATPSDYEVGVTSAAVSLDETVRMLAMAVMSNHLHDILAGARDRCLSYFDHRMQRIKRYLTRSGRKVDLHNFSPILIPIESLSALRNEIVYVNRNGYVAHSRHTPFSYPWSSGMYYFNPAACSGGIPYDFLPYESKRKVTHSRIMELSDDYRVKNDMIHIPSFVRIHEGEAFFRDAHHYFSLLSRNYEAYGEVAKRLGDQVFLTDDELFSAVCTICRKEYGQTRPAALAPNEKITIAVQMKQSFNATNGQIRRILRLDDRIIQELWGAQKP